MRDFARARQDYERDGVVCLRAVVDEPTVSELMAAVAEVQESPKERFSDMREEAGGRFFIANYMARYNRTFRRAATSSVLPAVAKALTGATTVRFFYDQLFAKDAGTSAATPWHHDETFWPITGEQTVSLWVALTPVDAESGYLEYIAGSHRWGHLFKPVRPGEQRAASEDDQLHLPPDLDDPAVRSRERVLHWNMAPGDVLCHHPLVVHGTAVSIGAGY